MLAIYYVNLVEVFLLITFYDKKHKCTHVENTRILDYHGLG